jgi:hypothetical protein
VGRLAPGLVTVHLLKELMDPGGRCTERYISGIVAVVLDQLLAGRLCALSAAAVTDRLLGRSVDLRSA